MTNPGITYVSQQEKVIQDIIFAYNGLSNDQRMRGLAGISDKAIEHCYMLGLLRKHGKGTRGYLLTDRGRSRIIYGIVMSG